MSNHLPIQFLLHQLATNEQDIINFNSISPNIHVFQTAKFLNFEVQFSKNYQRDKTSVSFRAENLFKQVDIIQIIIIRTCLSRTKDGDTVLAVFTQPFISLLRIYKVFDWELYNGHPRDTALQALHDKMLELVPEYQEFLNNNNK